MILVYRIKNLEHKKNGFFGISEMDLHHIVENVEGKNIEDIEWNFSKQLKPGFEGRRGDKVIPTARYKIASGEQKKITLFIKRHCNLGPNEAMHHNYLSNSRAPVPRLYAYYSSENCRDITVAEYIQPLYLDEPYDDFIQDSKIFSSFLTATAEFTSIVLVKEYLVFLETGYMERKFRSNIDKVVQLRETWDAVFQNEDTYHLSRDVLDQLVALQMYICREIDYMRLASITGIIGRVMQLGVMMENGC